MDNIDICMETMKLSEKYKKEIVDMTINYPKEEDEVLDTDTKKENKETE